MIRLSAAMLKKQKLRFFTCKRGIVHITPEKQAACGAEMPRKPKMYTKLSDVESFILCYSCWNIAKEALGGPVPDDLNETTPF